ncbi:MAG: right-handed parallel beta-helix repeat-containing protein [Polyangiales bacterium]
MDDGTPCAGGTCQSGACELTTSILPCTEQGIRNAVAAGGGPYTFDCDGPQTVVTEAPIVIDKDLILDGEGNLTVDGSDGFAVFVSAATTELRGFVVTGGDLYGVWAAEGAMTLTDSTVSGSRGTGLWALGATVTIANSTVSGNANCGIESAGGAMTIVNSTVSGHANCGIRLQERCGGLGECSSATLALISSTVSGHTAGDFGHQIFVHSSGFQPPNVAAIAHSLVDGACAGHIISDGYNVESPDSTCSFDQATDQVDVSADGLKLGPLRDNGGLTMTHALLPGSVAIDLIPADACGVDEDQRGEPRPGGTRCDVGAFEVQ